ncbi:MAG: LysE family translocator [Roseovarius sp.]|uniref:LysE family translocator n=1 Tax=Roseovarius sp. TaxID=1486281 RepID=UPI0040587118
MDALWSFLIAAFALTGSPGPNTLSLAGVGASFGRRRGVAYLTGLTIGMVLVIAIVGTGISGAIMTLPGISPVVTGLAAAYFLYLAWRIATAPPLPEIGRLAPEAGPRWYEGIVLSLANPKAYAAMAALFSGHVLVAGNAMRDGLWKAGLALAVICTVNIFWLLLGAGMAGLMRSPRTARAVNIAFAVLLLASVLIVAVG